MGLNWGISAFLLTNLLVIDDAILAYVPVLQFFNLLLTLEGLEDLTKAFLCCIFVVVITTIKFKSKLRNEWEESYLLLHWLRCTSPDVQRVKMRCIVSADGLKVVTRWSKNLYRQVTCRTIIGFWIMQTALLPNTLLH